jgi:hypothetical protein
MHVPEELTELASFQLKTQADAMKAPVLREAAAR